MDNLFQSIRSWWGEAIEHAFGDPRHEKLHQPPCLLYTSDAADE